MKGEEPKDSIHRLITTYNDFNNSIVDELPFKPSPLEFLRYVARNRPFVVRDAVNNWPALRPDGWSVSRLKDLMQGAEVNVAITPDGNADAPTIDANGKLVFAKPHEEAQNFDKFLDFVIEQELKPNENTNHEVRYAQTQNDNLRNEYSNIFSDVAKDIDWACAALQKSPDAINMWIGNSRSTTALHKDPYQNIYCQIIGHKIFSLLPPVAHACVAERQLISATYGRTPEGGFKLEADEDWDGKGDINGDANGDTDDENDDFSGTVPFATWDPDDPDDTNATPYSHLACPMRVVLEPGDILYLPAFWYHKVSQECSEEGICCAVNYWYDMDYEGDFYPMCEFVRNVTLDKLRE